jgi:hypothetical protein
MYTIQNNKAFPGRTVQPEIVWIFSNTFRPVPAGKPKGKQLIRNPLITPNHLKSYLIK